MKHSILIHDRLSSTLELESDVLSIGFKKYEKPPVFYSVKIILNIKNAPPDIENTVRINDVTIDDHIKSYNGCIIIGRDSMENRSQIEAIADEYNILSAGEATFEYFAKILYAVLEGELTKNDIDASSFSLKVIKV